MIKDLKGSKLGAERFIRIEAGSFEMGSKETEVGRDAYEGPVRIVTIKDPFYIGAYLVTQGEWEKIVKHNPSCFKGEGLPVENVSWNDVQGYIKWLNENNGTHKYRLPSEAEWEYAARAGTTTRFPFGDDESVLENYAWYSRNSDSRTHSGGMKRPNKWGIYDMIGNVWEWVQDEIHMSYKGAPTDGRAWENENSKSRVVRGGSWNFPAEDCRSASRSYDSQSSHHGYLGFRLVRL